MHLSGLNDIVTIHFKLPPFTLLEMYRQYKYTMVIANLHELCTSIIFCNVWFLFTKTTSSRHPGQLTLEVLLFLYHREKHPLLHLIKQNKDLLRHKLIKHENASKTQDSINLTKSYEDKVLQWQHHGKDWDIWSISNHPSLLKAVAQRETSNFQFSRPEYIKRKHHAFRHSIASDYKKTPCIVNKRRILFPHWEDEGNEVAVHLPVNFHIPPLSVPH